MWLVLGIVYSLTHENFTYVTYLNPQSIYCLELATALGFSLPRLLVLFSQVPLLLEPPWECDI